MGGGGGTDGVGLGGGGGYVACGTLNVTGGASIPRVVGASGTGGVAAVNSILSTLFGSTGGVSSFGSLLSAAGEQFDSGGSGPGALSVLLFCGFR